MKRNIHIGFLILILSFTAWGTSWGKDWTIDSNHSAIQFNVKHIFSTVFGSFSDFSGKIRFDPEKLNQSSFDFVVQVKSINTGNGKRDNHLRSKDFFGADDYSVMTFKSSKIRHKEGKTYWVTGVMTLKETSTSMEIPFVFHGTAPSPFNKKQEIIGFDTRFNLDRLAFGVGNGKFHQMGVVGDQVEVVISVEAIGDR